MYCQCIKKAREQGFTAMHERDASGKPIHGTFDYSLWVCAGCMLPTRMVFDKLTEKYTPRNAIGLNAVGRSDGTTILTWRVPDGKIQTMSYTPYPSIKVNGMDQGRNHLLQIWQKLDHEMDEIKSTTNADLQQWSKYRARAFAEVIAQLMSPFYESADDVAREAMVRWQARQDGVEHESPGLAEQLWNPLPEPIKASPAAARKAATPKATGNRVPESAVETAKQGIEMGMFTVKQMADTYRMTEAELKEQLGLA